MTTARSGDADTAARRWADALASWAIPDEILAAAPVSPYGFDVRTFSRLADDPAGQDSPSVQAAREALPEGGSVLDVGCGAGAGSMPLVPKARLLIGFDEGADMLDAFAERAAAKGVAHSVIEGRWPDAADKAPPVDVVVCHNVFYNVADLGPFVQALHDHARRRVVVELTEHHPLAWMNPLWEHVHLLTRPDGPSAGDAASVVREAGYDVQVQRWERTSRLERSEEEVVAFVRQRLCVGPERDAEIRELLERFPVPASRKTATLSWSPRR